MESPVNKDVGLLLTHEPGNKCYTAQQCLLGPSPETKSKSRHWPGVLPLWVLGWRSLQKAGADASSDNGSVSMGSISGFESGGSGVTGETGVVGKFGGR